MSTGLAPSKSTVYVSNLPFSLTNNDLHKIFEKYGKVVKVTIMCDKQSRRSKGVAFVMFLMRDDAYKSIQALDNTKVFGRTIKCSIAKDNGRAADFIRRKIYKDKSQCYQCGESEHLSYNCPNNILGDREPPKKKEKKSRNKDGKTDTWDDDYGEKEEDGEKEEEEIEDDSLATAIKYQQIKAEEDDYRYQVATGNYQTSTTETKKPKYKKDGYFSDEEELDDEG